MSSTRYRLKLEVGNANVTLKLKTLLGDVKGLQEELVVLQEKGLIKKVTEQLNDKYSKLQRSKLVRHEDKYGICDACGGPLGKNYSTISTATLAGICLCSDCSEEE